MAVQMHIRVCLITIFGCLCLMLIVAGQAGASLTYSGLWDFQEDQSGDFQEAYRHSIGSDSSQAFTPFLTTREGLRYGFKEGFDGQKSDFFSPGIGVAVDNQFVRFGVNGSSMQYFEKNTNSSRGLGAFLMSKWENPYWPTLNLLFQRSETYDDLEPRVVDLQSETLSSNIGWNLSPLRLNHNMSVRTNSENAETTSHNAQAVVSRSFLDNRFNFSFSHNVFVSDSSSLVPIGSTGVGYLARTVSATVLTGTDITPADTDDTPLAANFAMSDSVLNVGAYLIGAGSTFNSIVVPVNGQPVGMIYLYTLNNLGDVPLGMTWQLYSNNALNLNPWQLEGALTVSYDATASRFEIDFPGANLSVNYLKLVIGNTLPAIDFTEVVPYEEVPGTPGSSRTIDSSTGRTSSSLALSYQVSSALRVNASLVRSESEIDEEKTGETSSHQAALHYNPEGGDFGGQLQFARSISQQKSGSESESNSLGITLNKAFLPTLHSDFGWTVVERVENGQDSFAAGRFFFDTTAKLYPDLSSRLDMNYSISDDLILDNEITYFDVGLALNSRLKSSLYMLLSHKYMTSDTNVAIGNDSTRESNTSLLSLNWQMSRLVAFHGAVTVDNVSNGSTALTYEGKCSFKMSKTMESNLTYSLREESSTKEESARMNWNWAIARNLKLSSNLLYEDGGGAGANNFLLRGRLSYRFSTM